MVKPFKTFVYRTEKPGNVRHDQEPLQSNSISFPRHQTGKEHKQLRQHKVQQYERKAKGTALFQQIATKLS